MANTGYIINPKVIQIFTTGPNSGSVVDEDFNIEFNISSSFTSSLLCNNLYEYKIFNPLLCPPPTGTLCISPTFISASNINCGSNEYNYNIIFNTNINNPSGSIYKIEYSQFLDFSITGSEILNITSSNNIINHQFNISEITSSILNDNIRLRFRIKNICNISESLYSNIISTQCIQPIESYLILLERNTNITSACGCYSINNNIVNCLTDIDGNYIFNGLPYYINNSDYINATQLYLNTNNQPALPGWYHDTNISRYWDGNNFINSIYC
jgi:hypothetical protein